MAECIRCFEAFPDEEVRRNWEILFGRENPINPTVQALMHAGDKRWFRSTAFGICARCRNGLNSARFYRHALKTINDAVSRGLVRGHDSLEEVILLAAKDPVPAAKLSFSMRQFGYGPSALIDPNYIPVELTQGREGVTYQVTRRREVGYGLPGGVGSDFEDLSDDSFTGPPTFMPPFPSSARPPSISHPRAMIDNVGYLAGQGPRAIPEYCDRCGEEKAVKRVCQCLELFCKDCFSTLRLKLCPRCGKRLPLRWTWFRG